MTKKIVSSKKKVTAAKSKQIKRATKPASKKANKQIEIEFTLVRHGQTVGNISRLCQGHMPGQLSNEGFEQAARVGRRLIHAKFDKVYVSDLQRTRQTWG